MPKRSPSSLSGGNFTPCLSYDAQFIQWSGVFVPAEAPQEIIDTLNSSLGRVAANPGFAQTMLGIGSPLDYQDAIEFEAYWKEDAKAIAQAVNKMGKIE